MEQLKTCPFCGKLDKLVHASLGDTNDWFVECERCHVSTHAVFRGPDRSASAWNTRAADPVKAQLVEALKAARAAISNLQSLMEGELGSDWADGYGADFAAMVDAQTEIEEAVAAAEKEVQ